jgi:hypothetical protein
MTPIVVYLSILCLLLLIPIGFAITTLLSLEERVIVPLLRIRTGGQVNQSLTLKRTANTREVKAHLSRYAVTTPIKLNDRGGQDDYSR